MNLHDVEITDFCSNLPEDVAISVMQKLSNLTDNDCIAVIGYYEDIADLFKELCKYDEITVGNAELEENTNHQPGTEYIIMICDDGWISVSPLYFKGNAAYDAEIVYVYDDISTKALKWNTVDAPTVISVKSVYEYSVANLADGYDEISADKRLYITLGETDSNGVYRSLSISGEQVEEWVLDKVLNCFNNQ